MCSVEYIVCIMYCVVYLYAMGWWEDPCLNTRDFHRLRTFTNNYDFYLKRRINFWKKGFGNLRISFEVFNVVENIFDI